MGLGIILLYLPLYAYRRLVDDRKEKWLTDGALLSVAIPSEPLDVDETPPE
jgi:hypothetical protein